MQRRPPPGFAHVLGAAAGAFAVVAIVAFVVEVTSDDPTAPGVAFDALLAIAALAVGFVLPGPIRSACVTALVLSIPLVWGFGLLGDGNGGRGDVRAIYLLTLACYLVLYLVTWTKGRAIFLAGTLLLFASWLSFEVAGSQSNNIVPFQGEISNGSSSTDGFGFNTGDSSFSNADDTTNSTATVALVLGLIFLGAGTVLDRRKFEGAATPFIAVGALEAITGAVVLGGNESVLLGGLLAVAAGAVVGIVGAQGERRRATTWIGVLTVFGGLVAVLVDIAPSSAAGVGGIALAFAAGLGVIAWWLAPVLGEPNDGDDQPAPPEPTPPGGDILPMPDEAAA
ncbi:MAG: hypothetical protein WD271_13990 [Acidimicrobiia bacterium]